MRLHRFRVLVAPEKAIQLNPHQAPLVYATLAAAYGIGANCGSVLPDGVLVEAPEQGRVLVEANDPFAFGWTMLSVDHRDAQLRCTRLINGLRQLGARARHESKPFAGGFNVVEVRDVIADKPIGRDGVFEGVEIVPDIHAFQVQDRKLEAHATGYSLDIRLISPLRMQRPSNEQEKGSGHAFADPHWFCGRRWLRSIDQRLRDAGLDHVCPDRSLPEIAQDFDDTPRLCDGGGLSWLDLPYQGEGGSKSLGGVVGTFQIDGIHAAWLPAIFWGQLIGAGRNTAMGLGRYQVHSPVLKRRNPDMPEGDARIDALVAPLARSASLLDYALSPGAIDRGAARYGLEVGQAISTTQRVRDGTYQPDRPTRFVLHDGDKRPRQMVVPTPRDRAIQVAVLESITPAMDRYLETSSFAYRRGLGRHSAAKAITKWSAEGYRWAVRSDIHRFFDTVDHTMLRSRIEAYLPDPPLVNLLMTWVQSQAAEDGSAKVGLPTGAPVSPVLANLLLDRFDEEVEQSGGKLVRYADDFLILHRTEQAAKDALAIAHSAAEALRLKLNADKTAEYAPEDAFEFLGFRFEREKDWRFRSALPVTQVDALGWVDLKDASRTIVERYRLPPLPGESKAKLVGVNPIAILSPKVARLYGKAGELVALDRADQELKTLRCRHLSSLIIQGTPTLDSSAIAQIIEYQIDVLFLSAAGHPQMELKSKAASGSASLRIAQLTLIQNADSSLPAARALAVAKLCNTAAMARSLFQGVDGAAIREQIFQHVEGAERAESHAQLLGFEGAGAAVWYREFGRRLPKEFQFAKREAPRATDPGNALLNVAHTHLHRLCEASAMVVGLLPDLGVLHRPRSGHQALASDLQEPFRHLADRAVWVACTELSDDDFQRESNASQPITIRPRAMRRLFQVLFTSLAMNCEDASGINGSYRDHLFRQARQFRHWVEHREETFVPFTHRH